MENDILFDQKVMYLSEVFKIKISPYKLINNQELGTLKNGAELNLEYQKLLLFAEKALLENRIKHEDYTKIRTYLGEIYNRYINNSSNLTKKR